MKGYPGTVAYRRAGVALFRFLRIIRSRPAVSIPLSESSLLSVDVSSCVPASFREAEQAGKQSSGVVILSHNCRQGLYTTTLGGFGLGANCLLSQAHRRESGGSDER